MNLAKRLSCSSCGTVVDASAAALGRRGVAGSVSIGQSLAEKADGDYAPEDARTRQATALTPTAALELPSRVPDSFQYADLQVTLTTAPQPKPPLEELRFGQTFTDHMLCVRFQSGSGWAAPHIMPFGPLQLHPAAQVLHYGTSCFEGMKAYLGADGKGRLFRPDMNVARLRRSAARLMLADFDPVEFLECLKALLRVDRSWMPAAPGHSMYLRPFMYSTGSSLGVARSSECNLGIMLSPVGPYFKTGLKPVSLFLDEEHVRAWPGGVGQYKIGGNYAPTLLPMEKNRAAVGTPQVVYSIMPSGATDPEDARISESGAMNFFVAFRTGGSSLPGSSRSGTGQAAGAALAGTRGGEGIELVTPPLDGTILPGVTRDSIMKLASSWGGGLRVSERHVTIRELVDASARGDLVEMFGCGTACVVQPVEALLRGSGDVIKVSGDGALAKRVAQELGDIQYGRVPGHPWSVPFE